MLLPENATTIAVGALLIVLAFFYTGSSNRAFARGSIDEGCQGLRDEFRILDAIQLPVHNAGDR